MRLEGRVAIITGSTRGIGMACAQEFAREGARVVGAGRTVEQGRQVVDEIRAEGGDAVFVACDVSQKAQIDRLVGETIACYGTIDILVNNAGVNHAASFLDITEDDWDRVMDVDLKGTFLLSQAVARIMIEQQKPGVVVNISSVMAVLALADQIPYCAAKGGVNQLTKAMALALVDKGVRVNACGPGPVMTELMQKVVHDEEKHRQLMDRLPIGYIAECREIARVCVFLASDDASYLVGQTIYPDGGRMIQSFPRDLER
jgi:glucose 1-dehydrogenase